MAMDQFVNQAAKNRYMFGGQASIPVVFRSAMFYGLNTGAHHSDRPYPDVHERPRTQDHHAGVPE
jgi:pyruvate dehydrogenase E1 component beta subunit